MYKPIDTDLCSELISLAHESPRKRSHRCFHADHNEVVQRVVIGLVAGTYVRPHLHPNENVWELIFGIQGESVFLIFDESGKVMDRILLSPDSDKRGIELFPGSWHTVFPLCDESVIFEIKAGPYDPTSTIYQLADWAPEERDKEQVLSFLTWAKTAHVGDVYSDTKHEIS
ncbi:MAG: WbuC family cupin fold metalloprotein [Mariprofundaceae bacterium]